MQLKTFSYITIKASNRISDNYLTQANTQSIFKFPQLFPHLFTVGLLPQADPRKVLRLYFVVMSLYLLQSQRVFLFTSIFSCCFWLFFIKLDQCSYGIFDLLHWITFLQDYLICFSIFCILCKLEVKCNIDCIQVEHLWRDYFVPDVYCEGGNVSATHENSLNV